MIRCILIDDEPLALQQMESYISKIPYLELVSSCQSAIDAQEVLKQEKIDAMFCDINLPELSGLDFVKSLFKNISVIKLRMFFHFFNRLIFFFFFI